jgi:short-subunit dehydrogenase
MSVYMQGLRHKAIKEQLDISITDIRPGFVETPMTSAQKGMFWVQKSDKAARQIADAIEAKKGIAYITRRWVIMATLLRLVPDFLWNRT